MKENHTVRLAILASGAGSNAHTIIHYFKTRQDVSIVLIASNKKDAGVLAIAAEHSIPTAIITRANFIESTAFLEILQDLHIDAVILAGFLWKVPAALLTAFPDKIINIHPALLPKYGGKGMYGHFVHEAVAANHENESGFTIHLVNEHYDEGQTLFQARVALGEQPIAQDIEQKVRALEIRHFPSVIDQWIQQKFGQKKSGPF